MVRMCGSAASRNSPGRTKGAPYTNSADEMLLSSLGAALRPNSAHGKWSGQAAPAVLLFRASFNCLWALSTRPLLWGWYAVVVVCFTPSLLQRASQMEEVNWVPLSEVMRVGTPNLDTQPLIKASAQEAADMSRSGIASNHLVDLSTAVKM
jgi:hypothetical protein